MAVSGTPRSVHASGGSDRPRTCEGCGEGAVRRCKGLAEADRSHHARAAAADEGGGGEAWLGSGLGLGLGLGAGLGLRLARA
eukprot:scaffold28887_cov28-Phaeocystis_antarctica.AAC.1